MVWKQILKDLRKEWAWAFFYTVVATMIAMAILYLSVSFSFIPSFPYSKSLFKLSFLAFFASKAFLSSSFSLLPNASISVDKLII